jgi:DnaJ-class molecular chaperone
MSPGAPAVTEKCPNCGGRGCTTRRTSCNCGIGGHLFTSRCVVCQGRGERVRKCARCGGRRRLTVRDPSTGGTYQVACGACDGGRA